MTTKNNQEKIQERIEQLLTMAWNTKSIKRTLAIVNQILEIDPDNIDALIIKADNTKSLPEIEKILICALNALKTPKYQELDDEEKNILFYLVNQRLAMSFFYDEKFKEAFIFCKAAMDYSEFIDDPEAEATKKAIKDLYYRLLIMREQWQEILAQTMKDDEHTLAWSYSRLIAAWMMASENREKICAHMFWDALMISPDVPFYMMGYFAEPDDNASQESHDSFDFALMFYDAISVSEEFSHWFTRGVILFGLLSNRFEEREKDYLIDVLDSLGGYEEYERMNKLMIAGSDEAIIEMLAANKCLSE